MEPQPGASSPDSSDALATSKGGAVQLSGWRLWGISALVAGIGAWGLVMNVGAFPIFWAAQVEAEADFQPLHVNARWDRGVPVVPQRGGVADLAGMPTGRLVSVDGQPVAEDATIIDAAALVRAVSGDSVRLTVAATRGDTVTTVIPRTNAVAPEFAEAGLTYPMFAAVRIGGSLFLCLVGLAAALVLLLRRPRSAIALVGAGSFLFFASLSPIVGTATDVLDQQNLLGAQVFSGLSVVALLLFLALFPDGRVRPRWAWALPVAAGGRLVVTLIFPGTQTPTLTGAEWFALLSMVALAVLGVWAQAVRYQQYATEDQQRQTKWALLGIASGLAIGFAGILFFVLVPAEPETGWWWWRVLISQTLQVGFVLIPLGVMVSLLRYRLWDAEAAWSRSAMAAALTLALTAIIAGGTALMQAALGTTGPLALGLATAAAAVFFVPLQRRLSDWADHRFLRDLTDLKERLPQLVAHLRETESVEGIAEAVTDRVLPAVHATHVALAVPVGEGWTAVGTEGISASSTEAWTETVELASPPELTATRRHPWRDRVWRQPEDRLFPVRVALRAERAGGELATEGWLLLGPRPDGSGYGPDDLEAVAEIAGPVGRALRVVRVREDRDAELAASFDALRSEIREELRSLQVALTPDVPSEQVSTD
ncbi:MAG: hypothetical protein Rubg2KO_18200 [Rubricoccaceae bacterium]